LFRSTLPFSGTKDLHDDLAYRYAQVTTMKLPIMPFHPPSVSLSFGCPFKQLCSRKQTKTKDYDDNYDNDNVITLDINDIIK
jgi:hypothetical protein